MPLAKGSDKGDDHCVCWNAMTAPQFCKLLSREARWVEHFGIDAVWVADDAFRRNATVQQFVTQDLRDRHDQMGMAQVGCFDLLRQSLLPERAPPVSRD